ncbi:MAG: hypothetical protein ACR2RB_22365, partial [Gammaproteobacteria bacterium]
MRIRPGPRPTSRIFILITLLLTACGGSGDSSSGGGGSSSGGSNSSGGNSGGAVPASPARPVLTFPGVKTFRFTWSDVRDATHYRLLENPDGASGFRHVGNDIAQGVQSVDHIVSLYRRKNAQYLLQSCNAAGCNHSAIAFVSDALAEGIGYIKASNTEEVDNFYNVSLSSDGNTLAVGAIYEDSRSIGINGVQTDNAALNSGAVYVFRRRDSDWSQEAYIKASNTDANDFFGSAISLSGDGDTLAVGAGDEDSSATGINGIQTNNLANSSGAVYVFSRNGAMWTQRAYLKGSNTRAGDTFGHSVSLSGDGN